ncbi:hypothetical protein OPQ81_009721 [Rhizoctonia solani]|nr:hypothetical protein OPQ81_009721 [Rhizoctonia solani]
MRIIVAEEGRELQPDAGFQELYQQGNLSLALQSLTGIPPAAQLVYLPSGEQLREENVEELLSGPDLTLYIFNRDLLNDPNPPNELFVPCEALPATGDVIRDAEMYLQHIHSLGASVEIHHQALSIILRNLESHFMVLADAYDSFRNVAQRELDRQKSLLEGHKLDLEIISKVKIHPEFLSAAVRRGVEATGRERTLGDYVSGSKMQMVAESCARLHDDLSARYSSAVETFGQLVMSIAELKSKVETEFSNNAALAVDGAEKYVGGLGDETQGANLASDQSKMVQLYMDICNIKNASTEHVFLFLSEVSDVQRLMSSIPETLATLESDFRQKGGFPHLQRLHGMLYMYGATVIEVVRRREFSRFFMEKAQAIAEVLAKISSHERKRRQVYRSEVHGQLPFDPRGMEEPAPTMEISTSGGEEPAIALERQDIAALLDLISQIERSSSMLTLPPGVLNPAAEARLAFERLITKLDSIESDFDRLAERAVLSTSRIYQSRRQSTSDQSTMHEIIEQLREAQAAKIERDIAFQRETASLKAEAERLKQEVASASAGKQRLERLEIELDVTRAKHATELATRQGLEQRLKDSERARNVLQQEVDQLRAGAQANNIAKQDAAKISALEEQKAELEASLDRLQIQNRRLEEDLELMRQEKDDLNQIIRDKDAILKEQVSTAERSLRDHIAETDGDRAVLEQQVAELRHALDNRNSTEIQKLQLQVSRLEEDKQQLAVTLSTSNQTVTKLARAAHDLYSSHTQALSVAQNLLKASRANSNGLDANPNQSLETPLLPAVAIELPAPLPDFDPVNPQATIDGLTALDSKVLEEAVAKIGTNARKYLKLSKEYRERSKSKITFRNFARGDLALFLPTRNSIAKPWAAFNVAFPHYFLNATEDISELLKSREWIVARIVSITERIADSKQPNGNPFGLGDGVKFHLLDVEDWTQPSNAAKKRIDSNPPRPLSIASYEARERISSWTETTALATTLPQSISDREGTSPGVAGSPGQKFGPRPPSPPRYFSKMSVSPSAGPSSLSKVLAQAPVPSSPRPSSTFSTQRNANAERSRSRTTSLSSVRPPQFNGSNKAAATTALSDPAVPVASSTATPEAGSTPSPSGSAFEGMSSVALAQRRPTSISPGISAGSSTVFTDRVAIMQNMQSLDLLFRALGIGQPPRKDGLASKTHVDLYDYGLSGQQGAEVVLQQIRLTPHITHINLGHNPLGDMGLSRVIDFLCLNRHLEIEELNLNGCTVNDFGLGIISRYIQDNRTLRRLYLAGNNISGSSTSTKTFAKALNHSRVQTVVLANNERLELHLSRAGLTRSSLPILNKYLTSPACYGLRGLHLNANHLSNKGLRDLVGNILKGNTTLCRMEVFANGIETDDQESSDDATLPDASSAALQIALERNAVRLRRIEYEARELLVISRTLLLARESRAPWMAHNSSSFPWCRVVPELQYYILGFLHITLSDAQRTRIFNYASNKATLPAISPSYVDNQRLRHEWIEDYLLTVGCNRFEVRPV